MNGSYPRRRWSRRRAIVVGILATVAVVASIVVFWLFGPSPSVDAPARLVEPVVLEPPEHFAHPATELLSVSDARRTDDGWWIIDRRARRLHLFDAELTPVRSFGERGEGPGEFRLPEGIALRGDTILVLDTGNPAVIHLFDSEGAFLRRERISVNGCTVFLPSMIVEGVEELFVGGNCMRALPRPSWGGAVARVGEGGTGTVVFEELLPLQPGNLLPDVGIVANGGGVVWGGHAFGRCLTNVTTADDINERSCLEGWTGVRYPKGALAEELGGGPRAERIESILGSMEWLPILDKAFGHPRGLILRRLTGIDARELVLLERNGRATSLMSNLPETTFVQGDEILIGWEGLDGIHLEVRALVLPPARGAPAP